MPGCESIASLQLRGPCASYAHKVSRPKKYLFAGLGFPPPGKLSGLSICCLIERGELFIDKVTPLVLSGVSAPREVAFHLR